MTNFDGLLDGSIVGLYLLITMAAGLYVRKYVGKVDDFLVAGREMNVYLGIASFLHVYRKKMAQVRSHCDGRVRKNSLERECCSKRPR